LCRPLARPVGEDTGLREIRERAESLDPDAVPSAGPGAAEQRDMVEEYIDHVLTFVDVSALRPLIVAADAANGMAGLVVPRLFERLPLKLVPLYMDLDGTFPNHPAD